MKQWNTLFAGAVSAALLLCASAFAAEKQQPTKQWPFDRLPEETLRSMKKKVFAHYFSQFPISIDDRDPANDYYQKGYLHPDGENGKHRAYGHFINQRPIPAFPAASPTGRNSTATMRSEWPPKPEWTASPTIFSPPRAATGPLFWI